MSKVRFIDVDGTIFHAGTDDWLPGVEEKLKAWREAGDTLILFTMRGGGPWIEKAKPYFHGYIQKPCADEYYMYDDHLVEGRQSICCRHEDRTFVDDKLYCADCNIFLYPDEAKRTA